MYAPSNEQRILDADHLRLLRIGFFVSAGVTSFYALLGLAYVGFAAFMGTMMSQFPVKPGAAPPPEFLPWIGQGAVRRRSLEVAERRTGAATSLILIRVGRAG